MLAKDSEAAGATASIGGAYLLLSILALVGLSVGSAPFTVDLPNHAARLFIECNQSDPILSRMYSVEFGLIPNLAIDLINRPFCGLIDPLMMVRVAMVLAQAGILIVVWKLHRLLHGKPSAFVLLAPALTFNVITGVGYVNYLIGTFLFIAFAWTMLRFRILDRNPWHAIALGNFTGVLLFFCHVFALALAIVFLFGLRFGALAGKTLPERFARAALLTAASFALPLLMVLLADQSGSGVAVAYDGIRKLRSLFAPLLYSAPKLAAALACIWIIAICLSFQQKIVTIAPSLRWPLALLVIYAFALPSEISEAVDLDSRSLTSIGYLAIASIGAARDSGVQRRFAELGAALLAIVTISLQLWSAIPMMLRLGRDVGELRSAVRVIEPGATLVSFENPAFSPPLPKIVYWHLASYATLERKVFNPLEFTGTGMQPLVAKPAFRCVDVPVGSPISINAARRLLRPDSQRLLAQPEYRKYRYGSRWDERFDYVLYYHFGASDNPFPSQLTPVRTGTFFTIFRTTKPRSKSEPCQAPIAA